MVGVFFKPDDTLPIDAKYLYHIDLSSYVQGLECFHFFFAVFLSALAPLPLLLPTLPFPMRLLVLI